MEHRTDAMSWASQIDASGRILIPAETRQALGLDRGTKVVIETDGDSLRILTLEQFTKEVQELFGSIDPDEPLLSERLIFERRQEAARESRS